MAPVADADIEMLVGVLGKVGGLVDSIVELATQLETACTGLAEYYGSRKLDVGDTYVTAAATVGAIKESAKTEIDMIGDLVAGVITAQRETNLAVVRKLLTSAGAGLGAVGATFAQHTSTVEDLGTRLRASEAPDPESRTLLVAKLGLAKSAIAPARELVLRLVAAVNRTPAV